MGCQSVDLREDEELAVEVRKYPVLYDKSLPQYKEKIPKANAWRKIEAALGLERGKLICKCFDHLLMHGISPVFISGRKYKSLLIN